MNIEWFVMNDVKKHTFNNKVWIPLYSQDKTSERGKFGYAGFQEDFFACQSFIVPLKGIEEALKLDWMDGTGGFGDKPWVEEDGTFHTGAEYELETIMATRPVLIQRIEIDKSKEFYLHQDLVLALGLKRIGDNWVCPEEDDVEVVRLKRDSEGEPVFIEMKAEFLKDYLAASKSGLMLLTFQSRHAIEDSFNYLPWQVEDEIKEKTDEYLWSGLLREIHEGGSLFNEGATVIWAGRTDTDYSDDIPVYEFPTDENTRSKTWTTKPSGQKLTLAMGEIWKKEWISPGLRSPRVRGDNVRSTLEFIVDNEGNKETSETLQSPSRWLWFHPNVVNDLLKKRTSVLIWHSEDTGGVGGAWHRTVHFGVNAIGLINVYAKDIAILDEIDKKIWAGHNVSPEGKVSAELLSSQMQAIPASTDAPEQIFFATIQEILSSPHLLPRLESKGFS